MYNFFKIHKMGELRGIRVFVRLYKPPNAEKKIYINKDNNNNDFEVIQKAFFFFFFFLRETRYEPQRQSLLTVLTLMSYAHKSKVC